MKQLSWVAVPVVALGSALAVASTLLHHTQAHRLGVPGGYLPLGLGAVCVGLVASVGCFLVAPQERRSVPAAILVALVVAFATSGLLLATLIWAFGS